MSRRVLVTLCLAAAALLTVGCSPSGPELSAGAWPQFRGPLGLGISEETDLPVRWSADSPNIRWRAPIPGSGLSSPVISGDRIFLTTIYERPGDTWGDTVQAKSPKRVVLAYDLETGERLWDTVLFEGGLGKRHWSSSHATPTPATDGRHLFVTFDAHLAALDFDGNVLWHHDLDPDYYQKSHYGVASSPVLAGELVVLHHDREQAVETQIGWIAAFDKESGEQVWRDEWTHTCCSYSTPLVVERAGRTEIWNSTALEANGYDARTGEKLWRAEHPSSQTVPSMVRHGDLLSAPGGMHTHAMEMFQLSERDGNAQPERLWTTTRAVPEISSPVLYIDRIFSVTKNGTFFVRDARTGEVEKRKRLPWGNYQPSLVAGDGKVYVMNEEGLTVVFGVDEEGVTQLARNQLPGGSGASAAIADGSLFIRTKGDLFRIDRKQAASDAS